jgi:hypothetical protein
MAQEAEHLPRKHKALYLNLRTTRQPQQQNTYKQKAYRAGSQWLTPVILATQEAEIMRIEV